MEDWVYHMEDWVYHMEDWVYHMEVWISFSYISSISAEYFSNTK